MPCVPDCALIKRHLAPHALSPQVIDQATDGFGARWQLGLLCDPYVQYLKLIWLKPHHRTLAPPAGSALIDLATGEQQLIA